jgi:2-methylcitrate dehydratase PrpD
MAEENAMRAVDALADYVQAARDQQPSPEAHDAAIRCILDLLAAVAAGLDTTSAVGTRRVADIAFGGGASPIWFTGTTSGIVGAAWSNSAAASALDLDDGNRIARGHPGAAVIPAAFSVATETGASFDDLIKAIVVGYEVGVSVAASRGFHARTGMWSCYGVVAATALLRRTPLDQTAHAFAIAGMTAPNLLFTAGSPRYPVPEGNDIKEGIPWSTAGGIVAVLQAEAGVVGPRDILDHAPHHAGQQLIERIGRDQHICNTYFKLYSCCRHVHAPADALLALVDQHRLDYRAIEAVAVHTYGGALLISNRIAPANLVDVQFSIPYCLGLAATLGPSALLPLTEDVLNRDDVTNFARKVTLHLDPALDSRFPAETLTRLVVSCAGRTYESEITAPRGEAACPLSWQQLEEKFVAASRHVARKDQQSELLNAVRQLKAGSSADLMTKLAGMTLTRL